MRGDEDHGKVSFLGSQLPPLRIIARNETFRRLAADVPVGARLGALGKSLAFWSGWDSFVSIALRLAFHFPPPSNLPLRSFSFSSLLTSFTFEAFSLVFSAFF